MFTQWQTSGTFSFLLLVKFSSVSPTDKIYFTICKEVKRYKNVCVCMVEDTYCQFIQSRLFYVWS